MSQLQISSNVIDYQVLGQNVEEPINNNQPNNKQNNVENNNNNAPNNEVQNNNPQKNEVQDNNAPKNEVQDNNAPKNEVQQNQLHKAPTFKNNNNVQQNQLHRAGTFNKNINIQQNILINNDGKIKYNPKSLSKEVLDTFSGEKDTERLARSPEMLKEQQLALKGEIEGKYKALLDYHFDQLTGKQKENPDLVPMDWKMQKTKLEGLRDKELQSINTQFKEAIKTAEANKNAYINYVLASGDKKLEQSLVAELAASKKIRDHINDIETIKEKEKAEKFTENKKVTAEDQKMQKLKDLGYKTFTAPKEIDSDKLEVYMRSPEAVEVVKKQQLKVMDKEIKALEKEKSRYKGNDGVRETFQNQIDKLKQKRSDLETKFNNDITQAKENVAAYLKYSGSVDDSEKFVSESKALRESSQSYAKELTSKYVEEKPKIDEEATKAAKPKRNWGKVGKIIGGACAILLGVAGIAACAFGLIPLGGPMLVGAIAICGGAALGGARTIMNAAGEGTAVEEAIKGVDEGLSESGKHMKQIADPVLKGTSVVANAVLLEDMKKAKTTEEANKLQKDHDENMKLLQAYQNAIAGKDMMTSMTTEANKVLTDKAKEKVEELKKEEAKAKAEKEKEANKVLEEQAQAAKIESQKQERNAQINTIKWKADVVKAMVKGGGKKLEPFANVLDEMVNKLGEMKNAAEQEFKEFKQNFEDINVQIQNAFMKAV